VFRVVLLKTEKDRIRAVTFDLWETLLYEKDGANCKEPLSDAET
jgi:hypothetical protein